MNVQNLLDRRPPFAANKQNLSGYGSEKTRDPVGRVVECPDLQEILALAGARLRDVLFASWALAPVGIATMANSNQKRSQPKNATAIMSRARADQSVASFMAVRVKQNTREITNLGQESCRHTLDRMYYITHCRRPCAGDHGKKRPISSVVCPFSRSGGRFRRCGRLRVTAGRVVRNPKWLSGSRGN